MVRLADIQPKTSLDSDIENDGTLSFLLINKRDPVSTTRSASQYLRDKFTNNKRKGGGGLGSRTFYDWPRKRKASSAPVVAPAGTLDLHLNEKEMDQEVEELQRKRREAEGLDLQSPRPVGLPHNDDGSLRQSKSPRLRYEQINPQPSKTRSIVAALASGVRSCFADVQAELSATITTSHKKPDSQEDGDSPQQPKRSQMALFGLLEPRRPQVPSKIQVPPTRVRHPVSGPRSGWLSGSQPQGVAERLPNEPQWPSNIQGPPHGSLPPICDLTVGWLFASQTRGGLERLPNEFWSFSCLVSDMPPTCASCAGCEKCYGYRLYCALRSRYYRDDPSQPYDPSLPYQYQPYGPYQYEPYGPYQYEPYGPSGPYQPTPLSQPASQPEAQSDPMAETEPQPQAQPLPEPDVQSELSIEPQSQQLVPMSNEQFEEMFGEELDFHGCRPEWLKRPTTDPTPGLVPSDLPAVSAPQQGPSSEDGELESPPVDAHPPLMPLVVDGADPIENEAGSSTSVDQPEAEQVVAQSTSKSDPAPEPVPQLEVATSEPTEADRQVVHTGFLTPLVERATRERTISGLIRRYSLLEVQLEHELNEAPVPVAYHALTEVGRRTRVLDDIRREMDNQPAFRPDFAFPERQEPPRVPTPGSASLENALELTVNGRAPPRPDTSTIDLPTDDELRAIFDSVSETPQCPSSLKGTVDSDDESAAQSTPPPPPPPPPAEEAMQQPRDVEEVDQAELERRRRLAESYEAAVAMRAANDEADQSRLPLGVPLISQQVPETPPRWIMQDTLDRSGPPRSTPRWNTEPALRYASFRTQQSIRSAHRMDSLAPKDRTVGTDAIQYLATAELHPDFKLMYTVTEMLGAGGYGFVCIAETTGFGGQRPGIEVAVKFLLKQRPGSEIATPIPMFGDEPLEAFLLRNIDHEGIIGCYDLFEDDVMWYMVLELHGHSWVKADAEMPLEEPSVGPSSLAPPARVDSHGQEINPFTRPDMPRRASHDLFEAIEHTTFTLVQCKNIFMQIVDAVDYLHQRGVFHRDLKDENVVIDKFLQVKLIDFGSAVMEDLSRPRTIYVDEFKGTEAYAPPEVFDRGAYEAADTDIWALGILCAVLASGDPPVKEQNGRIRPDRPRLHRRVDPDAYDLICQCMRSDPRKRISIEGIIAHRWLHTLHSEAHPSLWTNGSRYRATATDDEAFFEDLDMLEEETLGEINDEIVREVNLMQEEDWSGQ